MTTAKTHDDLTRLLVRYDSWQAERAELAAHEDGGGVLHRDAWANSDDVGVGLLDEIVTTVRALNLDRKSARP